jgi:rubredoxin
MRRTGQHGEHFTCYTPMRYDQLHNRWLCPFCGSQLTGGSAASRRIYAEVFAA